MAANGGCIGGSNNEWVMIDNEKLKDYNLEVVEEEVQPVGELQELELEGPVEECPILFDSEVDWLIGIMPDKWLTRLLGRLDYGTENMEYYYNKDKCLSCGAMNYIKASIVKVIVHRQQKGEVIEW